MIPVESQKAMDCIPKSQSITQPDCPGEKDDTVMTPAPTEDVFSMCFNLAEAVSMDLPLNAEDQENNRISHDGDAILDQEMLGEFTYPFIDPYSTLAIQVFDQVCESDLTFAGEQNSQTHIPEFSCPFDYELEKLRRNEENSKKSFEKTRSELKAELDKKIAELRSEYDGKFHELNAEYNVKATEINGYRSSVQMNSLLANAFVSKCTDPSAATNHRSVRARSSQHPIQQWQGNTTASPPVPNQSGPLLHFPHCTTIQPRPISQQPPVQPTVEALSLRSNTTQPKPPPLIANYLTPSLSSSAYGVVRAPAPHLQVFRGSRVPNASTTYQRRLAQEQQQGNSNGELVCLSDDDE